MPWGWENELAYLEKTISPIHLSTLTLLMLVSDFGNSMKINLGCGKKRIKGYVNVDSWEGANADITQDSYQYLKDQKSNVADEIYSRHFLEHLHGEDVKSYMAEMIRVLKPGGKLTIIVPHWSNPAFYSDPTHKSFFGLYTMNYFASEVKGTPVRPIPCYSRDELSILEYVRIEFLEKKFPGKQIAGLLNTIINKNWRTKHIYETRFAHLMPCYQLTFRLTKKNGE